jgi:hypothetical protein
MIQPPTSLHLRGVAIVEITGLNPSHVFMMNDEKLQIGANRLVWDRHLRIPRKVGGWEGVAAYNEKNVETGGQQ